MYYVYVIQSSKNDYLYTGFTKNLIVRVKAHNEGKCITTNRHRPFELKCAIQFIDMQKALDFEKYLKSHSGRAFRDKRLI